MESKDVLANLLRFFFLSGKPIGEPGACYGPVVMNTQEELRIAFEGKRIRARYLNGKYEDVIQAALLLSYNTVQFVGCGPSLNPIGNLPVVFNGR